MELEPSDIPNGIFKMAAVYPQGEWCDVVMDRCIESHAHNYGLQSNMILVNLIACSRQQNVHSIIILQIIWVLTSVKHFIIVESFMLLICWTCSHVTELVGSMLTSCIPGFVSKSRGQATVSQVWWLERSKSWKTDGVYTDPLMHADTLTHTLLTLPKGQRSIVPLRWPSTHAHTKCKV